MNILLVGSGPAAFICLQQLLTKDDLNITLIDNSSYDSKNFDQNCIYTSKSINTSRIKNENIFENTNDQTKNLVTKNFGGLSTVWGSSISEISDLEKKEYINQNLNLDEPYLYLKSEMNFISKYKSFSKNVMSLPTNDKIERLLKKNIKTRNMKLSYSKFLASKNINYNIEICSVCNSYKMMCSQGSLWSTDYEIKKLIEKDKLIYLPEHKLDKFTEMENNVHCKISNNSETLNLVFDYVFIAAGPFGTSKIFLNSDIVNEVTIESSDLITIPYITKPYRNFNHTSHPELFIEDVIEEKLIYSQLYLYSDNLLKIFTNHNKFLSTFRFAPNIIKNIFGGLRIFLDPKISSKIHLTKEYTNKVKKNIEIYDQQKQKQIVMNHLNKYRDYEILPLNFLKKTLNNGESYHFGSQFKHAVLDKNNCSDDLGRIKDLKKTFVVDSSVLPLVNTGPITFTTMANSYRITKKFLERL